MPHTRCDARLITGPVDTLRYWRCDLAGGHRGEHRASELTVAYADHEGRIDKAKGQVTLRVSWRGD